MSSSCAFLWLGSSARARLDAESCFERSSTIFLVPRSSLSFRRFSKAMRSLRSRSSSSSSGEAERRRGEAEPSSSRARLEADGRGCSSSSSSSSSWSSSPQRSSKSCLSRWRKRFVWRSWRSWRSERSFLSSVRSRRRVVGGGADTGGSSSTSMSRRAYLFFESFCGASLGREVVEDLDEFGRRAKSW